MEMSDYSNNRYSIADEIRVRRLCRLGPDSPNAFDPAEEPLCICMEEQIFRATSKLLFAPLPLFSIHPVILQFLRTYSHCGRKEQQGIICTCCCSNDQTYLI
uniref:Uncharacterized protein n=1 Tax=Glossina austeni TaxID=7395 RepID=A0A1A9VL81_GLOAU